MVTVLKCCSRLFNDKCLVGFTVPEKEGADLGLCRVGTQVVPLITAK